MNASENSVKNVVLVKGDGIGPEISDSVVSILQAANAAVAFEEVTFGKSATRDQINEAVDKMMQHRIILKAPTETPTELKGTKSFNVTVRKGMGMFANQRPAESFHPLIRSPFPLQNAVVDRENEEGLYAAVEHRQTAQVLQALSYKSLPGMEKIILDAFEYAIASGRTRITAMHKGNILKSTEGEFKRIFESIASEYESLGLVRLNPERGEVLPKGVIAATTEIIDIGMANFSADPEKYQVIVTENLFGDILSDINAQLSGSVGLAGTANIGLRYAMFEAVHGTAPDIAGKNLANPSGLLQAAVQMLVYVGGEKNLKAATLVRDAWLWTLADGTHTGDVAGEETKQRVGTSEFTHAVIGHIVRLKGGEEPDLGPLLSKRIDYTVQGDHGLDASHPLNFANRIGRIRPKSTPPTTTATHGVDIWLEWTGLYREVLDAYEELSEINLADLFVLNTFHTLQEVYEYAHWLQTGIGRLVASYPQAAGKTLATLSGEEADICSGWGITQKEPHISDKLPNLQLTDLIKALEKITTSHPKMVTASSGVLAAVLNYAAKHTDLFLTLITNRGQSVWPTAIDPDLVDHMQARFLFGDEGNLRNPASEKDARAEVLELFSRLNENGVTVTKHEMLRSYTTEERGEQLGYASAYGQGMGRNIEVIDGA